MPNLLTNWSDVATIVGAVLTVGGTLYTVLRRMRHNDIIHLDIKLAETHETVLRIEDKLDRHLEAHAEGKFS